MIDLIERNRDRIIQLCKDCRVQRLELFGSAARGDFKADASDVDFLYEFDPDDNKHLADRFFSLKAGLEHLLGTTVDLVSSPDVTNPYFLRSANRDRLILYAA